MKYKIKLLVFMVSPSKIRSCSEKNTLSLADLQKATRIYYHVSDRGIMR